MPFVTKLTLQSGDRHVLETVVEDIKARAERKGVELRGPNPEPLQEAAAPQYRLLHPDSDRFEDWSYPVYVRTVTIVGHDEFARDVAGGDYPASIYVEAEVNQVRASG